MLVTTGFIDVSVGNYFSCGISSEYETFCWGWDNQSKLGDGAGNVDQQEPVAIDTTNLNAGEKFVKIDTGDNSSCGLTNEGNVYCWGDSLGGKLGNNTTSPDQPRPVAVVTTNLNANEKFTSISSGQNGNCAISTEGRSFCWGWNLDGQMGVGDNAHKSIPTLMAVGTMNPNDG